MKYLLLFTLLFSAGCKEETNPYRRCTWDATNKAEQNVCDAKYPLLNKTPTPKGWFDSHTEGIFFENHYKLNFLAIVVSGIFFWFLPLIVLHYVQLYQTAGDKELYAKKEDTRVMVGLWPLILTTAPVWVPVWTIAEGCNKLSDFCIAQGKKKKFQAIVHNPDGK